ncbi:MAG: hypothetical protein ACRC0Y_12325, partial [Fusobacteriaceae bacterium]
PYSSIREIDDLVSILNNAELEIIEKEKTALLSKTERELEKLKFDLVKEEELLAEAERNLNEFKKEIEVIRDTGIFTKERRLKNIVLDIEKKYSDILYAGNEGSQDTGGGTTILSVPPKRVIIRGIVSKTKYSMKTESDVENYIAGLEKEVENLKAKLLEAVRGDNMVDVN